MRTVGRTAAIGFAAIGAGAVIVGKNLFDTGVEMEKMAAKADIVFGDSIDMVNQWAEENAHAMGLTTREATGVAASIADILVPLGFARDEAAKMSTDITGLTGALAAWDSQNRSAAEIGFILQSALTGEREALKSLGSVFGEAEVQAKVLEMGLDDLTGEAEKQAVAMATLALINESTADAQTSFAENSDTVARKAEEARAKFREVWQELSVRLLPAFAAIATWILDDVVPALERLWAWFDQNIIPVISDVVTWVQDRLPGALATARDWWNTFYDVLVTVWGWLDENIIPIFEEVWSWAQSALPSALATLRSAWDDIWKITRRVWRMIEDNLLGAWDDAKESAKELADVLEQDLGVELKHLETAAKAIAVVLGVTVVFNIRLAVFAFQLLALTVRGVVAVIGEQVKMWGVLRDIIVGLWRTVWEPFINWIKGPMAAAMRAAVSPIQSVVDIIQHLVNLLREAVGLASRLASILPGIGGGSSSLDWAPGAAGGPSVTGPDPGTGSGRSIVVNVGGSVLSERDLENTLRDMSRRGLLSHGAAVRG